MALTARWQRKYLKRKRRIDVAILLPLANAVSEFGFSLQNIIKSTLRTSMDVDTTLDANMRCASLGPTDGTQISILVDKAVPIVFAKATPNRAIGAAAANAVRNVKAQAKVSAAPSASGVIAGAGNSAIPGDGSAKFAATDFAPFPVDKYEQQLQIPSLNGTLIGKQILYVTDRGDGQGLQFMQYKVASGKQKTHNDASGTMRLGKWKYSLKNAHLEINKVRLRSSDYGTDGRWYVAKKLRALTV